MKSAVISDSACLISLSKIDHLFLLQKLFATIYIPQAVEQEVGLDLPWLKVASPQNNSLVKALRLSLGAGESEVIALALEKSECIALIDDKQARRIASEMGVEIIGTVGLLLQAKRAGHLDSIGPVMDKLQEVGFRIGKSLYQHALQLAGE